MATHSSILAWRKPGTVEPGGLLSMGSHRVGHDWSDLAAAAAAVYLGGDPRKLQKAEGMWEGKEGDQSKASGDDWDWVLLWASEDHEEHTSDGPTSGSLSRFFMFHLPFVLREWLADDLCRRLACPVVSSLLQSGTGGQRARGAPSKKLQDMARVNEWFICFDNKINEDLKKKKTTGKSIIYLSLTLEQRRHWRPTPVLLPGKSRGGRSLVGCSPRGC